MRIKRTGKIADDFYALGNHAVPVYLLDGQMPVLFEAGFTSLALLYEKEIKEILGNRSPYYLFLSHSHFDHIGAAHYLKSVWPEMKIAGSGRIGEVLARPNALELIIKLNKEAIQAAQSWGVTWIYEKPFSPFDLDFTVSSGQVIDLGENSSVKVIHTPGHTWDFMSYWLPEMKILVASEAVGCDDGHGNIVTEFLVDYDQYRKSLEKLTKLDVEILCPGHNVILTGPDSKDYMRSSLRQAADYVSMVEGFLRSEQGNIKRVVSRVKAWQWDPKPLPKQPETAYLLNTQTRVKKIWERMQKRGRENQKTP